MPGTELFEYGKGRADWLTDCQWDEKRKYDDSWQEETLKADMDLNGCPTHPELYEGMEPKDIRMPVPTQKQMDRLDKAFVGDHDESLKTSRDRARMPEPKFYREHSLRAEFPKEVKDWRRKGHQSGQALQRVATIERDTQQRLKLVRKIRFAFNEGLREEDRLELDVQALIQVMLEAAGDKRDNVIAKVEEFLPKSAKFWLKNRSESGREPTVLEEYPTTHLQMVIHLKQVWMKVQIQNVMDWHEAKNLLMRNPAKASDWNTPRNGSVAAIPEADMLRSQLAAERNKVFQQTFLPPNGGRADREREKGRVQRGNRGGQPRNHKDRRENSSSAHQARDQSSKQGQGNYKGKRFDPNHRWQSQNPPTSQKERPNQPTTEARQDKPRESAISRLGKSKKQGGH